MLKNFNRVLAIGSHFDDMEIGAGGTVALLKKNGAQIKLVVVGNGDYSNLLGKKIRTQEIAKNEGLEALSYLGLSSNDLVCLNFSEASIPYNKDSVERIETVVNNFRPDLILTQWTHDSHQDHINTSLAVISASRYRNSLLMWEPIFPSGRFSPIPFVQQVYVDISTTIDSKINSLKSHKSQVKKFADYGVAWIDGITARAKFRGFECSSGYAETFYVYRLKIN